MSDLEKELELLGYPAGTYAVEKLDGLRKIIAARMTEAARDIPHFPLMRDISVSELIKQRNAFKQSGGIASLNDLMIKAAALALKDVPDANVSYVPSGLVVHEKANVAVAVAIPGGLMTPVILDADTKPLSEVAAEMKDKATRAQTRRLKPDEYIGGTITVSNLGMFGVTAFGSIINSPQAGILSIGASRPELRRVDGEIVDVEIATVTLTCDHRAIDGAIGARYLAAFAERLENPSSLFK